MSSSEEEIFLSKKFDSKIAEEVHSPKKVIILAGSGGENKMTAAFNETNVKAAERAFK